LREKGSSVLDEHRMEIEFLFNNKKTLSEIAQEYRVTPKTVSRYLSKIGLRKIPKAGGKNHKKKPKNTKKCSRDGCNMPVMPGNHFLCYDCFKNRYDPCVWSV
jgi:hypothetical protein